MERLIREGAPSFGLFFLWVEVYHQYNVGFRSRYLQDTASDTTFGIIRNVGECNHSLTHLLDLLTPDTQYRLSQYVNDILTRSICIHIYTHIGLAVPHPRLSYRVALSLVA